MTAVIPAPARTSGIRLGALRTLAVVILTVTAVALGTARFMATDPGLSSTGARLLQAVAAAWALALAPAVLAVMSAFRRSVLLVPAAMALWPLTGFGVAFFPVLIPLGIGAVLLMVAFAIHYDGAPCGVARGVAAAVVVPLLLFASAIVLFLLDDLWTYAAVTVRESVLSIVVAQTAVVAAWFLTVPD
jgi:hypothetical protein